MGRWRKPRRQGGGGACSKQEEEDVDASRQRARGEREVRAERGEEEQSSAGAKAKEWAAASMSRWMIWQLVYPLPELGFWATLMQSRGGTAREAGKTGKAERRRRLPSLAVVSGTGTESGWSLLPSSCPAAAHPPSRRTATVQRSADARQPQASERSQPRRRRLGQFLAPSCRLPFSLLRQSFSPSPSSRPRQD